MYRTLTTLYYTMHSAYFTVGYIDLRTLYFQKLQGMMFHITAQPVSCLYTCDNIIITHCPECSIIIRQLGMQLATCVALFYQTI